MKTNLLLFGLLLPLFAQAQEQPAAPTQRPAELKHWCGSEEFAGGEEGLKAWAKDYYANPQQQAAKGTLPVLQLMTALYLTSKSDGTGGIAPSLALGIMCDVNDDYRPHDIRFILDTIDQNIKNDAYNDPPAGSSNYFTTMLTGRKMANRTNIYFHGGGAATGLCGVYHGNSVGSSNATVIGTPGTPDVVNCFGGCLYRNNTTVTHELGHYLAMPHTFYGLESSAPSPNLACGATATAGEKYPRSGLYSNCTTAGDFFCDTYPDYNPGRWNCGAGDATLGNTGNTWSCAVNSYSNNSGSPSVPMQINANNYMSYADDACANAFTVQQATRMRNFITQRRSALLGTTGLGDTITQQVVPITPDGYDFIDSSTVKLVWNKTPNATKYIIQIIGNSVGTQILEERIVSDTTYKPISRLIVLKNYWWRVIPFNKKYFCTNFNAKRRFYWTPDATENSINGLNNANVIPNPVVSDAFQLAVEVENTMDLNIAVLDMAGRKLKDLGIKRAMEGENSFDVSANDLPNGIYLVQMRSETGVKTIKMIIAK
jgi:Secretion system C-terminal sorting domain/Pregnancy-associated plasma protein-A